jgi:N-acetylglutamate synthase-like GNAT family acetyltransferase
MHTTRLSNKIKKNMRIISVRENPEYKNKAIEYFQRSWPGVMPKIYEDCINHSVSATNPLPQWYLLEKGNEIIGCAGLITNDFISRMDLYPRVCAIFIEEEHRGNAYGSLLLEKAKNDTIKAGFENLYLCTDHIGYYEKYGFHYIGQGYHPWEEESRIYQIEL